MFRLATFFLLMILSPFVAPTLKAQDSAVIVIVLDSLRGNEVSIHSGPGVQYSEHLVSYGGLIVPATGRSDFEPARICRQDWWADRDMWLRVQFNEIEGWVWRCHPNIQITGDIAVLPVVTPAYAVLNKDKHYPPLTGTDIAPPGYAMGAVVRYVGAVVRAAPGLDAEILGSVTRHQAVYITGRTEHAGWVHVVVMDHTGWMASHLLSLRPGWQ